MSTVNRNNLAFPSLMNELFRPDWFGGGMENLNNALPAVNIIENEKGFGLELSVPGRKKEDFSIEMENDLLTISYESKTEDTKEEENYTRREFVHDAFKRSFSLPKTINVDKIGARYEEGILKLTLPKKDEALPKPKRMIELS
ncbi:MAG: Hsp20/alpha crystallin family protein [Flavobacteriales bacterium]|nr:MAG: Hsp20/alpha crystallin family protein [Flavobacteriales bacterium]